MPSTSQCPWRNLPASIGAASALGVYIQTRRGNTHKNSTTAAFAVGYMGPVLGDLPPSILSQSSTERVPSFKRKAYNEVLIELELHKRSNIGGK